MKSFKLFAIISVVGMLLTSCASVAHVEKDDTVNLSNYKTFSWAVSKEDKDDDAAPKTISLTEQNVRKAVNTELAKQGWREVKGNPDVLLSYDVLVEKTVKEDNNPVYTRPYTRYLYNPYTRRWLPLYYPSRFLGYRSDAYETREGTVTITMVDAQSGKQIWQGWTTDEVNSKNLTKKEIQSSVKSIFRKFDVAKR